LKDGIALHVKNDFSFSMAPTVRFKYPANGKRSAVDLVRYDGGMRPPTPPELEIDNKELPVEDTMFVGNKSKILAGFFPRGPTPDSGEKNAQASRSGSEIEKAEFP